MRPQDARVLAYGVALSRVAVGSFGVVAPGFAMHLWLGADSGSRQVKAMGLALGTRDLVLGLGTLQALREGANPAVWLRCGALADAADGLGTVRAFRKSPGSPRMLIALFAAAFAAVGWALGQGQEETGRDGG